MVDMTDIWTDLLSWWYDRWMSCQIHLNHGCDATPPQSTAVKIFRFVDVLGLSR